MGEPVDDPLTRIAGLGRAYRRPLGFPLRLAVLTSAVLVFLALSFLARVGTDVARACAAASMGLFLALVVLVLRRRAKKWKQPGRALFHALRRWDLSEAGRAERAYETFRRLRDAETTGQGQIESPELARVHLARVLDGVSTSEVEASARRVRRSALRVVVPVLLSCFFVLWFRPLMVVEGVDVLLARSGVGPFPLAYVSGLTVTAELPAYLDGTGQKRVVSSRLTTVPQGSEVEVRVLPQVEGRKLLLTDGLREVPLVSDGQGGLVARWTAEDASMLRVAARFGEVLLLDRHETLLSPLEDRAPSVHLAGAPARKKLEEIDDLELQFNASDDHGITQVDLVIESGQRTHREELAHLDGQKRSYQGAHRLPSDHEMLRRAFLPVRVRIEARDGNTATGPSWGKSQSIVLLPKPLGQEVAERHQQLRKFRDDLSRYLAKDMRAAHLSLFDAQEAREEARAELQAAFDQLKKGLLQAVDVPRHSLTFFEAQLEALSRKGAERSSSEAVLLATDALMQNVSTKEAQALSRDLGSAVEEIAVQAREIRFLSEGIRLEGLWDLVEGAEQGAAQLREVGVLGLDLGSVARGDLSRIRGSLDRKEYDRAEVAAIHLAQRLKRATPSFGSKGGAVESGTPQSGGSGSGEGGDAPPSEAPEQFQDLAQKVDALAQESAEELSELERMLREAQRAAEADFESSDDLKKAGDDLRDALQGLPNNAAGPGGPRAEAASARGYGEAMAEALDAQDLFEAIERGVDAQEALSRAQKMLEQGSGWVDAASLDLAGQALERALSEARKAAEELNRRKEGEMGDSLKERAAQQHEFSRRAEELARRASEPDAPLPRESIEALERAARLLEQAAKEMEAGRGRGGAEYSAEAQTQLERALPQGDPGEQRAGDSGGDEGSMNRDGSVPEEERDRARDFRRRVEAGLGRNSGRLSPAVRRYAEELK